MQVAALLTQTREGKQEGREGGGKNELRGQGHTEQGRINASTHTHTHTER